MTVPGRRYLRGQAYRGLSEFDAPVEYGKAEMLFEEKDIALFALGSMVSTGEHVREKLKARGYSCTLVNARFVKPLDTDMIDRLCRSHKLIVTLEENVLRGGMGMCATRYIHEHHPEIHVIQVALPDAYVEHGNVSLLREMLGIDSDSVIKRIFAEYLDLYDSHGNMKIQNSFDCPNSTEKERCRSMKERLDVLLVKKNLAESREKAKAVIMAGIVYVDDQKEDKAGSMFEETAKIEVRGSTLKYVSRGGLKLEKAMTHFGVTLDQKICMDVGASTGGFTDCMLQNGAVKVYSVDVGHGQLAWKLRNDPRVVCMEKTNIRYVTPEEIPDKIQFVSIDVSFISLTKVLGPVKALMEPDGQVVCLIKPQFEAGREKVGKKGVVRERSVHLEVIRMVAAFAGSIGFEALHLEFSPIKGPEGNIEYLLHLRNDAGGNVYENSSIDAEEIVNQAHETLD